MDKNLILKQESENDGQSIYLYYDAMAGVYLAFGLSAYYSTMAADAYVSYSLELQKPVALLRRHHILQLRQSLTKVEHRMKDYYKFKMRIPLGEEGYERWKNKVFEKFSKY